MVSLGDTDANLTDPQNGGTNCPACRGISSFVTPSRPLQTIVDVLLRAEPSRTRTERERMQADEIYKAGSSMRVRTVIYVYTVISQALCQIPTPREASPEPNLNQNSDYARPCPHCGPDNHPGWRCPQPIVDFSVDAEQAWHLDDGAPPGHAYCGNWYEISVFYPPTSLMAVLLVKCYLPSELLSQRSATSAKCRSVESPSRADALRYL